jgi:hypothetical protein
MITEGVYMAIVTGVDAELFIDQCEELLVRGWLRRIISLSLVDADMKDALMEEAHRILALK